MTTIEDQDAPRRSALALDVAGLQEEVLEIAGRYDFADGYFGETVSLLTDEQLHPEYRSRPYNQPVRPGMDYHRYARIAALADSVQGEKAGLMVQRREPYSSYGIHRDHHGEGLGSRRFNLPIVSPADSFLCILRVGDDEVPEAWAGNSVAFLPDLLWRFGERLDVYHLEAGYLHTFRFDLPHTIVNEGPETRYALLLDYLESDAVSAFAARAVTEPLAPIPHARLRSVMRRG